jgi:hypothetical protein
VIKAALMVSLWSLSSTALAEPAPAPAPVPATAAATPAPSRPRVLVLAPTSTAFDPATATTIGGLITSELSADARLDIIGSAEVERLAALEGDRQNAGCSDNSCLAELAGAIGARYVVFGDVGKLGDIVIVQLNLFDSQTAQALTRVTVQANSMSELPRALPPRVRELAAPLVDATSVSSTSSSVTGFNPWPAVLVGGGVVAIGVGAAIEARAGELATNGVVDLTDALAPVLWLVGGAAVVAGGVMFFSAGATDAP